MEIDHDLSVKDQLDRDKVSPLQQAQMAALKTDYERLLRDKQECEMATDFEKSLNEKKDFEIREL
jgi:hypothetical protein